VTSSKVDGVTGYQPTRIEEPYEVRRVTLTDGRTVRAVIATTGLRHSLVRFVNDRIAGAEDLPDCESAVRRASEIRQFLSAAS
jgi:hypothetical protein